MKELPKSPSDDGFDEEIIRALVRGGGAFPTSPEQVKAAKQRLIGSAHTLPERLKNAASRCAALLKGEVKAPDNVVQMPLNQFAEAKEELMRAARNGKEQLSSKVEDRMRANRAKARATNG